MQPSISVIENKTRQTKRRGNNTLQLSTPFCCISRQAKGCFAKKIKQCEIKIYPLDKRTIILYTQFCQLNKIFRAGCKSLPAVQPASASPSGEAHDQVKLLGRRSQSGCKKMQVKGGRVPASGMRVPAPAPFAVALNVRPTPGSERLRLFLERKLPIPPSIL